ncbi:MAG: DUF63 family protein [Candidatus Aenigmarchaeota archaeon]|nr:DUF63 family protein [Candidatus Aenigmarchaeota archaeon]MBU5689256.1 DUF63 family protein [Candidatus Aenigmarchaeota archaeon]
MSSFFEKYFVEPIIQKEGYNIVNTLFYSFIFILFAFLTFELLKKLKVKINRELFLAITPFILSFIVLRVLKDAGILTSYVFVTPNIWLLSFFSIIIFLSLSILVERKFKIPYYKMMFITGFIILSFLLGMIQIKNILAIIYIIPFLFVLILLLTLIKDSVENKFTLGIQIFDSIVTAVSINWFGYEEQHVLPRIIIEKTGTPFSFIFVKFFVVYISLKIIDQHEDKQLSNFIKLLIAILGLATGLRDLLRLLWYV